MLSKMPRGRPLNLLLEVGAMGGRTGPADCEEAAAVAREIAGMRVGYLRLAGIEAFEGIFGGTPRDAETHVAAFMERVGQVACKCDAAGSFGVDEVILTAGGSAFFDQVVRRCRAFSSHVVKRWFCGPGVISPMIMDSMPQRWTGFGSERWKQQCVCLAQL